MNQFSCTPRRIPSVSCRIVQQCPEHSDVDGDPNEPGGEECVILDPNGDQRLLLIEVDDLQPSPGRVHFDLASSDGRRDDEVARVVERGAAMVADRRHADGSGWVTLADPAGNHFCVVRSDRERHQATNASHVSE